MANTNDTAADVVATPETLAATGDVPVGTDLGYRLVPASQLVLVTDPSDALFRPSALTPEDPAITASIKESGQAQEILVLDEAGQLKIAVGRSRGKSLKSLGMDARVRVVTERGKALQALISAENAARRTFGLAERVAEASILAAAGLTAKEAAIALGTGDQTVRALLTAGKVLSKLDAPSKALFDEGRLTLADLTEVSRKTFKGEPASYLAQRASRRVLLAEQADAPDAVATKGEKPAKSGDAKPKKASAKPAKSSGKPGKATVTKRPKASGLPPMKAIKEEIMRLEAAISDAINDKELRHKCSAILAYFGEPEKKDSKAILCKALGLGGKPTKK